MAAVMQFYGCGIAPDDITPRVNVLTFKAWKALGRRVARGATGQRVTVWVPVEKAGKPDGVRPINAVLFHITQTIAEDAEKGTRPDAWNNPQLVKEGTYEAIETTQEPAAEPEPIETDAHAEELAEISHAEYKADEAAQERLDSLFEELAAPNTAPARKQLAMF